MAYPTLASLGGLASASVTAWGLIVVNILAMGVGTAYTSLVAIKMGLSRWFGLAFLLNPGMIAAFSIDGAGIVAMAGMIADIYYTMKETLIPAAVALSIAALAHETVVIAAVGLGLFVIHRSRRFPWAFAAPLVLISYRHSRDG